jgi:hypothetical protein
MGFQTRKKSAQAANREYTKPLREKRKEKARGGKRVSRLPSKEKHVASAKEVSEVTLRRLHTLGNQRFGTFPFSEHFDRWIATVTFVLCEFESNPNIGADEEYVKERSQILSKIGQQLEKLRRKEASVNEEYGTLADCKSRLEQIKTEYLTSIREVRGRKNLETRRLYGSIYRLKREQDEVGQVKTSFLRGIFARDKEQKETEIAQNLADRQRELELTMLEFKLAQGKLREEYERKREPVVEQTEHFQKTIDAIERDGSLEERWFACEALADVMNSFLQRKALQQR